MADPYVYMSIRELGELLRTGQVSPVKLTKVFLSRLENIGDKLNAVVTITRDRALDSAWQAEKEIISGRYRGPLHGIPYGVKDLLATSGDISTTWGAEPFRNQILDEDATVIRKLEAAGAILAAKLSMVELAGGMGYRQPYASFTGPGITPWNLNMWSGGSSSGSGSSVSAGLVPFAIGTETWGSILGPANHCGVSGLRPTYGRVSRHGAMALCWTLDKLGPLCLTADDCGLVLEAIAGPDPKDPTTTTRPYRYNPHERKRPFRLAVIKDVADDVDEAVQSNFYQAITVLSEVATVETIELPDLPYEEITRIILFAEAYSAFEDFIESGKIAGLTAPEDRYIPYARATILAQDYIRALRLRAIMAREVHSIMQPFDALVGPSRPTPATPLDEEFRSTPGGSARDIMGAIGNGAGLPAISVPAGFSDKGLPTGIQIMGKAYEENTVIAIANAYQSITGWHQMHPQIIPP
ncbi:MAG: amidase [Deltaproteobacteria bacterium]|nr:amidase [Deltaproteobacteria bacterium]MBW1995834.1 amidase [Deltaproteobacteria bacterium]MBW2153702.1 amidase [Deltaproteobacteria bacterium]